MSAYYKFEQKWGSIFLDGVSHSPPPLPAAVQFRLVPARVLSSSISTGGIFVEPGQCFAAVTRTGSNWLFPGVLAPCLETYYAVVEPTSPYRRCYGPDLPLPRGFSRSRDGAGFPQLPVQRLLACQRDLPSLPLAVFRVVNFHDVS